MNPTLIEKVKLPNVKFKRETREIGFTQLSVAIFLLRMLMDGMRAVHLPLVTQLLTSFDAVLRDKGDGRSEAFVFLKKFTSVSASINTILMW